VENRRSAVRDAQQGAGISERRASRLIGVERATFRYGCRRADQEELAERMTALAARRRRFGYRRLRTLLRREGKTVNVKRTCRVCRHLGLSVSKRRRKKVAVERQPRPAQERPNQRWSMDFVSDSLSNGRRIRCLAIVDDVSRECPAIEVDTSLPGVRAIRALQRLAAERGGLPEAMAMGNGPEFAGRALDEWTYQKGICLLFISSGKPIENAFIESFNGRFRDECLNEHWFTGPGDARRTIESWRVDCNEERPHSSLGDSTPLAGFTRQWHARTGVPLPNGTGGTLLVAWFLGAGQPDRAPPADR
jgi:putative transposase